MRLVWELFFAFLKIGTFTFGGGLAMLPMIRSIAVEEKRWLTEDEMIQCLALSQSLPGVLAVNVAVYIGNRQKNLIGSAAAVFGVILPAIVSILVILVFLGKMEDNKMVLGAFEGIKAASAALILTTVLMMWKKSIRNTLDLVIAVVSFALIVLAGVNAIWAIVFGGLSGLAAYLYRKKKGRCA